jgi:hypothetical protein
MKKLMRLGGGFLVALFPLFSLAAGYVKPAAAQGGKRPADYYVTVSQVRSSVSGTGLTTLNDGKITSQELRLGYFISPDVSVEFRYDNGGKMGSSVVLRRDPSYGLYLRSSADFASGFGDRLRLKGYLLGGIANNKQKLTYYSGGVFNQTSTGLNLGLGLLLEVGDTFFVDAGVTHRGSFDATSVFPGTNHRSFDIGIGAKF